MWFWLSLIALLCWSGSDLFSKIGCQDPSDKYSHLKIVMAVGVVMGIHAAWEIFVGGVEINLQVIITYLPVSILYILSKTRSSVLCVYHSISEDDVQMVMRSPYHVVCTDGIVGAVPHPRAYSTYPRFLGHYVRDLGIMPLETAINHITGEPARRLRLWDRGLIREGLSADLVLLDYDRIIDTNSYIDPIRLPQGICKVWVKGALRYQEGYQL